jgi:hypothetical protein
MDQFIENFLGYAGFGPGIAKKDVPATTFERYRGKLPDKLLDIGNSAVSATGCGGPSIPMSGKTS